MPPFASETSVQAEPDSMIALIVGCCDVLPSSPLVVFVFLAVIIGLPLIAVKKCYAPRSPTSRAEGQSLPSCPHAHHIPHARRGLALPIASLPSCLKCQKPHIKVNEAARISQEPVRLPEPLSPYYARRAPTGVPRAHLSSPTSSTTAPTTPPCLPLGYRARGPTATLRPTVW